MNEGKKSGRSKVARLAALGTAVALLGVSLGVSIPAANAQTGGTSSMGNTSMSGKKAHKGGKKGHKGGKKSKKGAGDTGTTPPPK